ncbi:MAG: hypothetical protein ACI4YB_07385 [Oscillospiraceae bacterium]
MIKKALIVISTLFLFSMLFLSLFAEKIHNANLPKVTVSRLETHTFEEMYTDENGKTHTFYTDKVALTTEQIEKGVYVVYSAEKNGTKRSFVRLAQVVTGAEKDGYFEIVAGLSLNDRVVIKQTDYIYDGCEVIIM